MTIIRKDQQWLDLCSAAAPIFSTCSKAEVYSVIVNNKTQRIIGTGFNGVPSGWQHCRDGGCPRGTSDVPSGSTYDSGPGLCFAAHAEVNALTHGDPTQFHESTLYVNKAPCVGCQRAILGTAITRVVCPRIPWMNLFDSDDRIEVEFVY